MARMGRRIRRRPAESMSVVVTRMEQPDLMLAQCA